MAKKAIFMALDNSGSMAGGKAAALQASMVQVLDSFSEFIETPGNTLDLGICVWSDTADTQVFRGLSRAGISGAIASLDRLTGGGGGTNFAAFAPAALSFFTETVGETYDDRTMIFLTDGAPTPASTADTAAATLADVLNQSTAPFTTLDGSEVNCYAANIDDADTTHTSKLDNTADDGVPVVAGSQRALTAYLKAVTIPVSPTRLWGWPIQWSGGYEEERAFRTDIITSRDGTEQRIGARINPRVEYNFTSLLRGRTLQTAIARASKDQGKAYFVPHPQSPAILGTELPSVGLVFSLTDDAPAWLVPGVYTVLEDPVGETALGVVISVDGPDIGLAAATGRTFPEGSKMRLAVEGRFDGATEFSLRTNKTATVATKFSGDPVETPHPVFGEAPVSLEGVEFFDMRPNWRGEAELTLEQQFDLIDFNRGAVDAFFPISTTARTQQHTYSVSTSEGFDRIFGLFYRAAGRRRRFFMPLWVDEIEPFGITYSGQETLTVLGDDFSAAYAQNGSYKRILIRRYGELEDLILTVDSIGLDPTGNSVITFTEPVDTDIIPQEIVNMNWIMPVRLASDRLTIDWLTDGVAEVTLTTMVLEGEA